MSTSPDPTQPNCRGGSMPFDYDAVEFEHTPEPAEGVPHYSTELECLHRVFHFIRGRITRRGAGGKLPSIPAMARRIVVLGELLAPTRGVTFAKLARELRCTRSLLSKTGREFERQLGITAPCQRPDQREMCKRRAIAVHRGEWQSTERWLKRKAREGARTQANAAKTSSTDATTQKSKLKTRTASARTAKRG